MTIKDPSPYQEAIFTAGLSTPDSFIIEAVAGSGKTTTQVDLMSRLPPAHSIAFAFNKTIQLTLESRVPWGVEAKTFNALGFSVMRAKFKSQMKLGWGEKGKNGSILKPILPQKLWPHLPTLCTLIARAKLSGVGHLTHPSEELFTSLAFEDLDLEIDEEAMYIAAPYIVRAYSAILDDTKHIDFDDQILLPFVHQLKFPHYDRIFVDESQDLSPMLHEILSAINASRLFAFGDTFQAIYAFRGADCHSMAHLQERFRLSSLPLSITYRCPRSVVEIARSFCPHIEAAPWAQDGSVSEKEIDFLFSTSLEASDMILCRNNAPLFSVAMRLLRSQIPIRVLSNFGESITSFIKSFKTDDLYILLNRLEEWFAKTSAEARAAFRLAKLQYLRDKYETVKVLAQGSTDVADLLSTLTRLTKSESGTTLSTIHKAKGLEAERVFFLLPSLLPSSYAKSPEELQQEANLQYVATTRAKRELIYLS